jgi:hypothetical protein
VYFYPEEAILRSHRRENFRSFYYTSLLRFKSILLAFLQEERDLNTCSRVFVNALLRMRWSPQQSEGSNLSTKEQNLQFYWLGSDLPAARRTLPLGK